MISTKGPRVSPVLWPFLTTVRHALPFASTVVGGVARPPWKLQETVKRKFELPDSA